jgi:hypothetical protein
MYLMNWVNFSLLALAHPPPPPPPLCFNFPQLSQLSLCKAEYFSFATKRSQAYAHALQYGIGTPKGNEHMAMVEFWKDEGEKALQKVSKCLLDRLFDRGKGVIF